MDFLKDAVKNAIMQISKKRHEKYIRIMQSKWGGEGQASFSLFTSDCMAGLIYHTLGLKFTSPTINMSIKDKDFLKLVSNYEYYLNYKFEFVPDARFSFPVGYLGKGDNKIEIRFNHYKSEEEAQLKWDERKDRVVARRFIVVADQGLSDEDIQTFKSLKAERKLLLTWKPERADNHEIFCVPTFGKKDIKQWSRMNADGFRDYERFFDYVAWLKMKDEFILI